MKIEELARLRAELRGMVTQETTRLQDNLTKILNEKNAELGREIARALNGDEPSKKN